MFFYWILCRLRQAGKGPIHVRMFPIRATAIVETICSCRVGCGSAACGFYHVPHVDFLGELSGRTQTSEFAVAIVVVASGVVAHSATFVDASKRPAGQSVETRAFVATIRGVVG